MIVPNLHLGRLNVTGFRGIRDTVDLRFGRRLTILYGGNASGKSSITQAVEFALSGQVLDQEDRPIAAPYLSHAMNPTVGRVRLSLTAGSEEIRLDAAADENRGDIEARFRKVGSVDWPDRHELPVTQTHITSQGMLARLLAADPVTRNDLSGLCAGAYLRSLLARAEKLAAYFRQGATGRNIQSDLKTVRAAVDSARVLHESLAASIGAFPQTNTDGEQVLTRLIVEVDLPGAPDIDAIVRAVDDRLAQADHRLLAVQRLLDRMRDLGQYEVELSQARELIKTSTASEAAVLNKQADINSILAKLQSERHIAATRRDEANATLVASQRYQRSNSVIESLQAQLTQSPGLLEPLTEQIESLRTALESASHEQRAKSDALVRLTADHATELKRLSTVRESLQRLSLVPETTLSALEARANECERIQRELRERQAAAAADLQKSIAAEALAEREFKQVSESDARFAAAASELESLVADDACTLCGHHHGTQQALEAAIQAVREHRLSSAGAPRREYDQAAADHRGKAAEHTQVQRQVQQAETRLAEARRDFDRHATQHQAALSFVRESLTRQGLNPEVSETGMRALRDSLSTKVSQLEIEIEAARQAEEDTRQRRGDLEQEIAVRRASAEQLRQLARELQEQIDAERAVQPASISAELVSAARSAASEAEGALAELQHAVGRGRADLAEQERLLTEARAQKAGAQRRLISAEGLLNALDKELQQVGATRDITSLLSLESTTRQKRDQFAMQKARSLQVREELGQIERNRNRIAANEQLRTEQAKLDRLQRRQERLRKRAEQFASLQKELEKAQSTTAEEVLKNVRVPVGMMFRAMTAGCQWDIEFSLAESGRVQARLLDGLGGVLPATAVLNSAYLNVSAIALRVALASQQNWTNLRTIVLDDPILEMDSLTQSALIDGLEAILVSPHSPWTNLQLVITTWSEDFAVLAAHKLAHLNNPEGFGDDQFVIYRLGSLPDGRVSPERHTPRWIKQATAA
jgi:DNA repair exonuclease SbcCD ATPase subunit